MFALDTNTLIYFFQGQGRVAEHLLARPPGEIGVPAVVLFELELGIARSTDPRKRRGQLDTLLAAVAILPFERESARNAAAVRAALDAAGTPIGPMDALIAGTALAHGAALVTRNTREFSRVAGLRLADWF